MAYLLFPNLAAAQTASRAKWVTTLTRTKNPQDVTEFLWPWLIGKDGRVALDTRYNPKGVLATGAVATLDPVNWPPLPTELPQ